MLPSALYSDADETDKSKHSSVGSSADVQADNTAVSGHSSSSPLSGVASSLLSCHLFWM